VTTTARFGLDHDGDRVELSAHRDGLRTRATVFRDGEPVGAAAGFGRIVIPLPRGAAGETEPAAARPCPKVLVLGVLPGTVNRALLLVPRPDVPADPAGPGRGGRDVALAELANALPADLAWVATAEKLSFAPPTGSLAAWLQAVERRHPRLWASRHVVLAAGKVGFALLGVTAFIRLLLAPLLGWLRGLLPDIDLPSIPLPDIDLPDIPWPDIRLPEIHLPAWLLALLGTAKFWGPILVGIGLAVVEVRWRCTRAPRPGEDRDADG
jgi:hypothetical protein